MARVWVLDTETKGTGAEMVPLESLEPTRPKAPAIVGRKPPRRPRAPEPRSTREFKVTDARSRKVIVERADARATVEALGEVRSIVDVGIHVWQPSAGRWRLLSHREKRTLWDAAHPRATA